jgi:hypothetical protein
MVRARGVSPSIALEGIVKLRKPNWTDEVNTKAGTCLTKEKGGLHTSVSRLVPSEKKKENKRRRGLRHTQKK